MDVMEKWLEKETKGGFLRAKAVRFYKTAEKAITFNGKHYHVLSLAVRQAASRN